jgi:hypothetical protein
MNTRSSWAWSFWHHLRLALWLTTRTVTRGAQLVVTTTMAVALLASASGCCGGKDKGTSRSFRAPAAANDGDPGSTQGASGASATATASATGSVAAVSPPRPARPALDTALPGNADRRSRLAQSIARAKIDPQGATFASPTQLTAHFQKHGEAMGYTSEMAYLAGAQHLIKNADATRLPRGRDTLYFLASTGEFAVVSQRGAVRTYFVPSDPDGYWARQQEGDVDRQEEAGERRRLRRPR